MVPLHSTPCHSRCGTEAAITLLLLGCTLCLLPTSTLFGIILSAHYFTSLSTSTHFGIILSALFRECSTSLSATKLSTDR